MTGLVLAWPRAPVVYAPGSHTWAELLAPLRTGTQVAGGFVLGSPRRGQEHDLVIVATRQQPEATVEVHVVDRGQWDDVLETASFGVAYEAPRSTASTDESFAVTRAVWAAVRAHDPGPDRLAPVETIPLATGEASAPPPDRAPLPPRGWRIWTAATAIALATVVLSTLPRGGAWTSAWLLVLGLLLRAPHLGLPFPIDQDVQRMFTGHLPLLQILTGLGLDDRHPPLYFVVLHFAQWAGQSESVGRAPAVLAGALAGPAIIAGAWIAARARGPAVALAALVAAVSPVLVLRSREVSEIPLFGLLATALCASYAAAIASASPRHRTRAAASGALALYTYYLAPLVIAGTVAAGWLGKRSSRRAMRAVAVGALVGAPAILLQARIFVRDEGAREAARLHPAFAWGQHGVSEMGRLLAREATGALGVPLLVLLVAVVIAAAVRRHVPTLVAAGALTATFAGIALVAPFARVQPYYLVAALPLALLAIAVGLPRRGAGAWLATLAVGAGCVSFAVPGLRAAWGMYERSPEESMTDMARVIDGRPERTVALTVDYDATLLAYDLARRHEVPMDWARMHRDGDVIRLDGLPQELEPLLRVHSPGPDPEGRALRMLEEATSRGAVLVVVRDGIGLDRLAARLARCTPLAEAPRARLVVCGAAQGT